MMFHIEWTKLIYKKKKKKKMVTIDLFYLCNYARDCLGITDTLIKITETKFINRDWNWTKDSLYIYVLYPI